jgi:hypothetical protein
VGLDQEPARNKIAVININAAKGKKDHSFVLKLKQKLKT